MNFEGIPDANVEDMSNSELFQYLFKAELDPEVSDPFTDALFQSTATTSIPSPSASSTSSLSSPATSTLSSSPPISNYDFSSSPETLSHSYNSPPPPPYQQQQQQEQEQLAQIQLFPQQPTLLPSSSFSYRQISPDMPPSMPNQSTLQSASTVNTNNNNSNFMNLPQPSAIDAVAASSASSDQMNYWMQRFQQLQQLQQIHHQQQQQLLSSTLFPNQAAAAAAAAATFNMDFTNTASATAGSSGHESSSASPSSPASSASSNSPTIKAEHYPSPPMKDDMAMDSDSDDGEPSKEGKESSDPLKPSPSELKKMTSKERRQLRNKLSARNFRVRRKEYIGTLENQVKEARREAAELQKKLAQSELNCQFLRQELETARLSQTLFNDGRMSREHANLLASLLNPNSESFPSTSAVSNIASSSILSNQELQQKELMNSINSNNMTILNNALTANQQQQQQPTAMSLSSVPQGSIQPFAPFDTNWELSVNRAEVIVNPDLDPKDAEAKSAVHELLARYEAAKHEAEVDEQMRTELKAYNEQKLAQTYIVMPKEDALHSNRASQDTMFLQTMVYMMMLHLTRSLFEAATLSKTQIVNVYQTMDDTLRSQMGQVQEEKEKQASPCKFAEWREAWIRKCWPSFYNNRQRVCELLKNGICPLAAYSNSIDVDETVRKMEEGVKGKTVEMSPLCLWIRSHIPNWMRCPDSLAQEKREQEREALLKEFEQQQPVEVLA